MKPTAFTVLQMFVFFGIVALGAFGYVRGFLWALALAQFALWAAFRHEGGFPGDGMHS